MTSSLVGSEMCIRDSPSPRPCRRRPCRRRPCRRCGKYGQPNRPIILDPVSYTHLTLPTICSV
eukprot:12273499-Prorocentrum_lima.AAC.1